MSSTDSAQSSLSFFNLKPGDPAPRFSQTTFNHSYFNLNNIGGGYVVMFFFHSSRSGVGQAAVNFVQNYRQYFNGRDLQFVGITLDPDDPVKQKADDTDKGLAYVFDGDGRVSRICGALPREIPEGLQQIPFRPLCIILDRRLRVLDNIPITPDGGNFEAVLSIVKSLPPISHSLEPNFTAPILVLPRIFEPDLCRYLISLYEAHGGYDSGFMNQEGGKTKTVIDYSHKRRRDYQIEDVNLIRALNEIMNRRLLPEIARAFQYHVTCVERQIVACYSSEDGGHFKAHRDNTTLGTAHRRFAVTFNLNDEFEGGELTFPEFGKQSYRAPVGGAVVFSCSLLHEAGVVTKGVRYAYLPFLYDDAAAKIREANQASVVPLPEQAAS